MKQRRLPQLILALLFFGLLAGVFLKNRAVSDSHSVSGSNLAGDVAPRPIGNDGKKAALARYGFYLENVAGQAGINFQHVSPALDPKLKHIEERVADMGAAVAVCDFDRDGKQDFYVSNSGPGSKNALYRNLGDWKFEDVASKMGVADLNQDESCMGAVWGDYDNDGYEDLLVYKWGRPQLFHNNGGKAFTNVSERTGLPRWMNANTAIWLDYDADGKLDLFLGGYFDEKLNLFRLASTDIMPDSVEYATNGTKKYLFRGNGDGTFTDVSSAVGMNTKTWTLAAGAARLTGGPKPDLVLANDYGYAELWQNENGRRLHNRGKKSGIGAQPKSGMNVAFGDIFNQGKFAIHISNITEAGNLVQYNNVWVPRAGTSGAKTAFDNLAADMGVGDGGWSFGAQFGDLNNDGNLDLYLTNGYLSLDRKKASYWYDFSQFTSGNQYLIHDAKNWPALKGRSLSGYQQKRLWLNDGAGKFQEIAQSVGASDLYDGRAVALADLDNNGTLDVLVANQRGPLLVYKNTARPDGRWVDFDLQGAGTPGHSNKAAIGTEVTLVRADGSKQLQQVDGGSGFCAQNQRRLHFGLGASGAAEKAIIRWPSGKTQTVRVPETNKVITVKEPA